MLGALERATARRQASQPDGRWSVQAMTLEEVGRGDVAVVLLWRQGPHEFGVRVDRLTSASVPAMSPDAFAMDLVLTRLEEPHGPGAEPDAGGRFWFDS